MKHLALTVVVATVLTGCSISNPIGSATGPQSRSHVFVIVLENAGYSDAIRVPYVADLAKQYAQVTDYHAIAHPSLPNYLALTSGSTWGIRDDDYHALPRGGIGQQLTERRLPWRAYMEGMGDDCMSGGKRYAVKHNPFAYFGGGCPSNVVPMSQLDTDLAKSTPRLAWITPDQCHDGHDCGSDEVEAFLRGLVPRILSSSAWRQDGLLLITWDEDDSDLEGNHVMTLVIAPHLTAHQSSEPYDHYSLLATVEDRLGLSRLGEAAGAKPFKDLLD